MWTFYKVLIAYIITIGLWVFWVGGLMFMSNTASSEYKKLSEKNKNLQKEIDEIGNTTTSSLLSKLKYYEEYFKKKRSIYALEIWGMIEYVIPSNNFIKSVSIGNDGNASVGFWYSQPDITTFIKIYKNLTQLKKMDLIKSYNITEISREWKGLVGNDAKFYKMNITINPKLTEDNTNMIEFLKKMDVYYSSIYNWPLRKVECVEYVNEEDGLTYCKSIDDLNKEALDEEARLKQIREDEEKTLKQQKQEIKEKKELENEKIEELEKQELEKEKLKSKENESTDKKVDDKENKNETTTEETKTE